MVPYKNPSEEFRLQYRQIVNYLTLGSVLEICRQVGEETSARGCAAPSCAVQALEIAAGSDCGEDNWLQSCFLVMIWASLRWSYVQCLTISQCDLRRRHSGGMVLADNIAWLSPTWLYTDMG